MNRRRLLALLVGAAWVPPAALAQAPTKVWRIGILRVRPEPRYQSAFEQGLRDLGHDLGGRTRLVYRFADGKPERFPDLAAEFVRMKVDVIVAGGGAAIIAARDATSTMPIVMALSADPVRAGFVSNLARPGGNVTGVSLGAEGFSGKWLELAKEVVPSATRVALLGNPASPLTPGGVRDVERAARGYGIRTQFVAAARAEDFKEAFAVMKRDKTSAVVVLADAVFSAERKTIVGLAAVNRLPAIYQHRDFVDSGGLLSYGPNFPDLFRRAAAQVDKILKGAKAGDLPVEQPTRFELVINLAAARALGLTVPQTVLLRADQVIE
jgi:putative ABC transport system substrate-binding protein